MSTYSAVIFDLDGTLTESKQALTPQMGEILTALLRKLPVAVFSGAAFHQFEKQFLLFLPANANLSNLYLFPTSAARCYTYENGEWKISYQNDLSQEERDNVVSVLQEGIVQTGIVDESTPQFGERIEDRGAQITFSALGQEAPIPAKAAWDPDKKKRMPLWQFLSQKIPDYTIAMNAMSSIDITRKGINKAYGVRRFADMLHTNISNLLYVGDALFEGGNDAVVVETGIHTHAVSGPDDTMRVIEDIIAE